MSETLPALAERRKAAGFKAAATRRARAAAILAPPEGQGVNAVGIGRSHADGDRLERPGDSRRMPQRVVAVLGADAAAVGRALCAARAAEADVLGIEATPLRLTLVVAGAMARPVAAALHAAFLA